MITCDSVILAGASVRSLAESALLCGLRPYCLDMFGDADLRQRLREANGPDPLLFSRFDDLPRHFSSLPSDVPVVWSGGLENHPNILKRLAERHQVPGISADRLPDVRSVAGLQALVAGTSCRLPSTRLSEQDSIGQSRWIAKPTSGSGGVGIRWLEPDNTVGDGEYLQQFVAGTPISALYISDGESTEFCGASRQLVGDASLGATGFAFCGNIGPVELPEEIVETLQEIGNRTGAAGVTGAFGVDYIIGEQHLWLIEVNPRITASHELYDFAAGESWVLRRHLQLPTTAKTHTLRSTRPKTDPRMLARLIVYQTQTADLCDADAARLQEYQREFGPLDQCDHWVADIPLPGKLEAGQPCCSVYHVLQFGPGGWSSDADNESSAELDRLLSRVTGIDDLQTAVTAVRGAGLFEPCPASDNARESVSASD